MNLFWRPEAWAAQLLLQTTKPVQLDLDQAEIYQYNSDSHRFEHACASDEQRDTRYAVITDIRLS